MIGKGVSAIVLSSMKYQFVLQQKGNDIETVASFELREGLNQRNWHELVILHSHLNRSQHSKVVLLQILNQIGV